MNENPLLSIIVPTYNIELYVEECLDSLLNQDYRPIQIIVVNGESKDKTSEKLLKYKKMDEVLVVNQTEKGLCFARNMGLSYAKGDFVTFVDGDDAISREAYSKNIHLLRSNPSLDFVQMPTRAQWTGANECRILKKSEEISGSRQLFRSWASRRLTFSVWDKIYRANILSDLLFEGDIFYEDMVFCSGIAFKSRKALISTEGEYLYRLNPESRANSKPSYKRVHDFVSGLARWIEFGVSQGVPKTAIARFYARIFVENELQNAFSFSTEERREIGKVLKKVKPGQFWMWMNILQFKFSYKRYVKSNQILEKLLL
jgi:glycosyltransferase involved in cell wall biosynthesis